MGRGVWGCHTDLVLVHTTIYSSLHGLRKTHITFWLPLSFELTVSVKPTLKWENMAWSNRNIIIFVVLFQV